MDNTLQKIIETRQLIHDTLSQTLFSASTLSGILVDQSQNSDASSIQTIQELDILIKEAVTELQAIQKFLHETHND